MKKRVLLAIDMEAPAQWAASYAVQLEARLELSLAVMAVFPVKPGSLANGEISPEVLEEDTRLWLGKIRERCQREGVPMEIFISSGPFYEEVIRFANSQRSVQFIIMGMAGDFPQREVECSPLLKSLHQGQSPSGGQGVRSGFNSINNVDAFLWAMVVFVITSQPLGLAEHRG